MLLASAFTIFKLSLLLFVTVQPVALDIADAHTPPLATEIVGVVPPSGPTNGLLAALPTVILLAVVSVRSSMTMALIRAKLIVSPNWFVRLPYRSSVSLAIGSVSVGGIDLFHARFLPRQ